MGLLCVHVCVREKPFKPTAFQNTDLLGLEVQSIHVANVYLRQVKNTGYNLQNIRTTTYDKFFWSSTSLMSVAFHQGVI